MKNQLYERFFYVEVHDTEKCKTNGANKIENNEE